MKCEKCGNKMHKIGLVKNRQKWRCSVCKKNFQEGNLKPRTTEEEQNKFKILASKGATKIAISEAFGYSRQCIAYQLKKTE